MAARAHIIIREKNNDPDEVLVYVADYGLYYGSRGVIRTLIKAYYNEAALSSLSHNLRTVIDLKDLLNLSIREYIGAAASSIVHVGVGKYLPVSKRGYEEYAKTGTFYRHGLRYIITISDELDEDGDAIWEIALKDENGCDITRTLKEWQRFSDIDLALENLLSNRVDCASDADPKNMEESIKGSIHLDELDLDLLREIYSNIGACPCDICAVRPSCVAVNWFPGNRKIREIRDACENKEDYNKAVQEYLVGKISHDKPLQDLLMHVSSRFYLTLKYTR